MGGRRRGAGLFGTGGQVLLLFMDNPFFLQTNSTRNINLCLNVMSHMASSKVLKF